MPGQHGHTAAERVVALVAAGAIVYLCFTPKGRASIARAERWLDEGEQGAGRLLDAAARATSLAGALAESFRAASTRRVAVTDFPSVVRRA